MMDIPMDGIQQHDNHQGTQFKKGRDIWREAGRPRKFATPEELWERCKEYFRWVEDNPIWEHKVFAYQGTLTEASVPKMRAMTQAGLCLFLGIDTQTWFNYKSNQGNYAPFFEVCTRVEAIIYEQKFTGAAADMLNASIIARDLGLADKSLIESQVQVTSGLSGFYDDLESTQS